MRDVKEERLQEGENRREAEGRTEKVTGGRANHLSMEGLRKGISGENTVNDECESIGYRGRHSIWPSRRGEEVKDAQTKQRKEISHRERGLFPALSSDVGLSLGGRSKKGIQVSLSVHYKIFDVIVPDLWKDS